MDLRSKTPSGPLVEKWSKHKFEMKLVNPANKRKYTVIVVGSGLAGGAAAASLSELGYNVRCYCYQDSPRRAHSIAAQGCINAATLSYFSERLPQPATQRPGQRDARIATRAPWPGYKKVAFRRLALHGGR
jgi:glycine/D-amino acid oxidase-like deaminating enzyme